jgi:eukaryotic-like serine/threonine-protein kinase
MTTQTATGQVVAGRYELTRFVAGGAMGEVWEAHDERMDRTVAVKVLRPEYTRDPVAVDRFRTEARLAARLAHPGIAEVHDVDDGASSDEPPWMVQEFVPGRPLSQLVAITGGLDPFRAAGLIAQAADAVHAAHLAGVVHRDLTPGNLLVCDGDIVKVTDFGFARASGAPALTATGQVLGAPAYLSPEQVGGRPATPASDVYTLGVVLHECLTGARPFSGANPVEVARAHLHQQPPPLPASVPEQLRVVTVQAMAKVPADRPSSAAEFATRLREVARLRPVLMPSNAMAWDWFVSVPIAAAPDPAPETRPLPKMVPSGIAEVVAPDSPPGVVSTPPPDLKPTKPPDRGPIPPPDAAQSPAPAPPVRTFPPASVPRGAAAVRLAARPPNGRPDARADRVPGWWSTMSRRVGVSWRWHPVSGIALTGGAVVLLVVLAVLWDGSGANAVPGIDTPGPSAGTVRVGDDVGKGAE